MYGFISGITDNDKITYCPKCGEQVAVFHADGTCTCESCNCRFGVVECEVGRMIDYRSCEVNGEKAIFHCWEQYSQVIAPSLLRGGHGGGQIAQVFGIVEFKDGAVRRIQPHEIKFVPDELILKRKKVEQMTEQEAIETIKYASAFNADNSPLSEALTMAINALEKNRFE